MPPLAEVIDALMKMLLPAAGTAALFYAIAVLLGGPRCRFPGILFGLAAAWAVGNYLRGEPLPWFPDKSAWHWLPWLAVGLAVVGSISAIGNLPWYVVPLLLLAAVGFVTWKLVPTDGADRPWWILPAAGGVGFANALILRGVARRHPGGLTPLAGSILLQAAGLIIAHAHFGKLTDAAMILSAALFGIAVLAQLTGTDAGPSTCALAALLPGLMLCAKEESFSELQPIHFYLPVAAPLAMGLSLLPPLSRIGGRLAWLVPLILLSIPLGYAVMLAMQVESLAVG